VKMEAEGQEEAWTAAVSFQYLAEGAHCRQLTSILTFAFTVCLIRHDRYFPLSLRNNVLPAWI